jgi:hypothetical protein
MGRFMGAMQAHRATELPIHVCAGWRKRKKRAHNYLLTNPKLTQIGLISLESFCWN